MTTVYVTQMGKIEEKELIKETPKGFRVVLLQGSTMELKISYNTGYHQFYGKHQRFEIATLDKQSAELHAFNQREDILSSIVQYQDYWLKHIGINPNQFKEILAINLETGEGYY